jgi:Domain of unknown function (DUF4331)
MATSEHFNPHQKENPMKRLQAIATFAMALFVLAPGGVFASSHREAPISALDHSADVTDWYAFVSYAHPDRVTMILNVDGFLEPSNGPNYFPFDPNVLYEMKIDNNRDAKEDITFQFRFKTDIRQPSILTSAVGASLGFHRSHRYQVRERRGWLSARPIP